MNKVIMTDETREKVEGLLGLIRNQLDSENEKVTNW